ncbi:MAG: hypothetical protein WCY09_08240, partial [Candidatus Omnitrophota bacterium]
MKKPIKQLPVVLGSEPIAYHAPVQSPQITICEHSELSTGSGEGIEAERPATLGVVPGAIDGMNWPDDWHEGQEGWPKKGGQETGGRSEKVLPPPKVTAKPSSPRSSLGKPLSTTSCPKVSTDVPRCPKPLLKSPSPKSPLNPDSDMPVLGDLDTLGEKKGGEVVQSYPQVPFTPENGPPFDTTEEKIASPFITGNERIDRRTAFTQYCRLGEGRTYLKVANV